MQNKSVGLCAAGLWYGAWVFTVLVALGKSALGKKLQKILLLLSCVGACACVGLSAPTPEGFARFGETSVMRAVSSDGVMYRVRLVDNDPKADLDFWREAFKKRMLEAGYRVVADGDITAAGTPGYLLELAAPVGQQDYAYAIAIYLQGSDIMVIEAAGEVTRFQKHRESVVTAMAAVEFQ